MIGLKDQCFGVEVEMTGITREQAATALAAYFATDARYVGGDYDKWCVTDRDGKEWTVMSDSSIHGEQTIGSGSPSSARKMVCSKPGSCAYFSSRVR